MKLVRADIFIYCLVIILIILTEIYSGIAIDLQLYDIYFTFIFKDYSLPLIILLLFQGVIFSILFLKKTQPNSILSTSFIVLNVISITWFMVSYFSGFPRRYYSFTEKAVTEMSFDLIFILASFILAQITYILSFINRRKIMLGSNFKP
ncbi:MAG TPA: hypothetical protein VD908_00560 [Cytophagales bacterium]|nr:hypothetical protein [Cytophagales bacterium]